MKKINDLESKDEIDKITDDLMILMIMMRNFLIEKNNMVRESFVFQEIPLNYVIDYGY